MIELTEKNIRLRVQGKTKEEAIRAAGQVLVESGCIEPGYVESMLGREQQANTYLSHGIAIPHGMPKDRGLIRKTGVSVVQFPEGVPWNEGQRVTLVVGIAAKSDEHLSILAALTDVLDDEERAGRLAHTERARDIIMALNRGAVAGGETGAVTTALERGREAKVKIAGEAGLHARPATVLVEVASKFTADIRVVYGDRVGNGKAMASLLKLGVPGGGEVAIQACGSDEEEALQALVAAVQAGLGEREEEEKNNGGFEGAAWTPVSAGRFLAGVCGAPGLAVGRLHVFQATQLHVAEEAQNVEQEEAALVDALAAAGEQLADVHDEVAARSGKAEAAIFKAHQLLLKDEELLGEVKLRLEAGKSAAWAWRETVGRRVEEMKALLNARLAERATDLHDVGQRVLRLLAGVDHAEAVLPEEPVILVADDLTPSDTARLDPRRVLGICTAAGGPTSHTAIIARSLDIPAVVGVGAAVLELESGAMAVLDGLGGRLFVAPSDEDLASAAAFRTDLQLRREEERGSRYQPAILKDGHRVEVVANIGKVAEAAAAVEAGAEGVGLLRTEFFFLDRESAPTEEEQYEAYREMVRALNGLPLIIRTLDIGGDKVIPYLPQPHEDNPFLGVRGIRLCLRQRELFVPQLRAVYRAAVHGPVSLMFPMIATLEDLREAKAVAESVRAELGAPKVPIGIMVEVPSTAVMAGEFAREADFFSIGTNDLTQYVLAMDRMHPALAKHVDGLHPAVLRLIDMTVRGANTAGKWVGVCGGVAGDPLGAAILTGLGVKELSMALPSVAAVKARLRGFSQEEVQRLARRALACATADEVRALGNEAF